MNRSRRPRIADEEIISVKNTKEIDFTKPFKFIYMNWWYEFAVAIPFFLAFLISAYFALKFRLKIVGRENLRHLRESGCILIANHCHYFDTVFANYVLYPKALHTAVAQRNYEVPYIRRILRILRAFPIPPGIKGINMITDPVRKALNRKHHILIMPEGNLVLLSQQIHRFYLGAFFLAYKLQSPILPITFVLKKRHTSKKDSWANVKIVMVIGKPLQPPSLREGHPPFDEMRELAEKSASWMEEVLCQYHSNPDGT